MKNLEHFRQFKVDGTLTITGGTRNDLMRRKRYLSKLGEGETIATADGLGSQRLDERLKETFGEVKYASYMDKLKHYRKIWNG